MSPTYSLYTQVPPSLPLPKVRRINLTVAFVLTCFAFVYYVAVFCVVIPWFEYSVPGVMNVGVLTITSGLALYCYCLCVFLDPGSVPKDWSPDAEGMCGIQEVKKKGGTRVCQKCHNPKPPRSHHCRVCQRCVLRMDHHCVWVNNCIGHANYKAFLMFLIYITCALVHTIGLISSHTLHLLQTSQQQRVIRTGLQSKPMTLDHEGGIGTVWLWALLQTLAFAISLPLTIGLLMLLGWHIQLVLANKTTIEYQEGVTANMQLQFGQTYEHPYDIGMCGNLHDILGPSPVSWLAPPCSGTPGGTSYRSAWDTASDMAFLGGR